MTKMTYTKIVGISFGTCQEAIKTLKEKQELKLVMEDNPFDVNALMVVTLDNRQVGYISRKFNQRIKKELEEGKKYKVTVENIYFCGDSGNLGVCIKILELSTTPQ